MQAFIFITLIITHFSSRYLQASPLVRLLLEDVWLFLASCLFSKYVIKYLSVIFIADHKLAFLVYGKHIIYVCLKRWMALRLFVSLN